MAQEHLDSAQLLAIYKEGEMEDLAALEHLASCAKCQQSFDDSRWLMVLRRLRDIVEAGPHPSSEELAAYRGHALSSPRIARIERHLRSCDRCLVSYRRERVVDRKLAYSSPALSLQKAVQRRFRPRPLRQLGTVLVRRLGEKLGLLFLPARVEFPADRMLLAKTMPALGRARRPDQAAHPASAARRKHRLERRSERIVSAAEEAPLQKTLDLCQTSSEEIRVGSSVGAGNLPPTVRIPADDWNLVLELALKKGQLFLRLISSEKEASVRGIRVRVGKQGQDPTEAVTDRDGRIQLSLAPGRSRITIHADPPFVLDFEDATES